MGGDGGGVEGGRVEGDGMVMEEGRVGGGEVTESGGMGREEGERGKEGREKEREMGAGRAEETWMEVEGAASGQLRSLELFTPASGETSCSLLQTLVDGLPLSMVSATHAEERAMGRIVADSAAESSSKETAEKG